MPNTTTREIVAGHDVVATLDTLRAKMVATSGPYLESESLCAYQREMAGRGFLGAEIVQSLYGYSLRYDSGLQNWGLIATARSLGGTLEDAVTYAQKWQAADPLRRYVTRRP